MNENCAPVSVVIPTYNGAEHLAQAIESVLKQTLSVAEIIVVDDGSSDQSPEIAEQLRNRGSSPTVRKGASSRTTPSLTVGLLPPVKVIRQANRGVSAARNVGVRAARGEWIAFLDQDDVWAPEKIELQWEARRRYPDVGIVSCLMNWFEPGEPIEFPTPPDDNTEIRYLPQVRDELPLSRTTDNPSSVLIRRSLLLDVGLFDEELLQNEDLECFLRLVTRSSLAVVERPLIAHRVHAGSRSNDALESGLSFIKLVDKLIAEPRKYPTRAAKIYGEYLPRMLMPLSRSLLAGGRGLQARALLTRSLRVRYSNRAVALCVLSFFGPKIFKRILSAKTRWRFRNTERPKDVVVGNSIAQVSDSSL